jgi:hypothetical protein
MRPDEAREFVASHHRAVLITRRSGGGLQTSPVLVGVDDEGKVLCVLSDDFFGRWIQIEGTAQVVSLPEAMDGLVDYYRGISGEHPDWMTTAAPCRTSSACSFASRSTRRVQATPASRSGPVVVGSAGGGRLRVR